MANLILFEEMEIDNFSVQFTAQILNIPSMQNKILRIPASSAVSLTFQLIFLFQVFS
jgi:hypothetical protein